MKRRKICAEYVVEPLVILALTLLICLAISVLTGCTKTIYVPQESVCTEYRDKVIESLRVDTVALRDSVAVYVNGDTVRETRYRDRWRTRIVERHDTCTVIKTDSVQVPVPVERKLTRWEQTKQDVGGMAMGGIVVAVAVIAWLVYKKRKR